MVVLAEPEGPLRTRIRCRNRPFNTPSSHCLTSETFFLCTTNSSRFLGPNRSDHGLRSSFSPSGTAGFGGLMNSWLAGGPLVVAASCEPIRARFRASCPTKLVELVLSSDISSSDMGSLIGSSTGTLACRGLGTLCACLENKVLRSPDFPFSSPFRIFLVFFGLGLAPFFRGCDLRGRSLVVVVDLAVFEGLRAVVDFLLTGLGEAVGCRFLAGDIGDEVRKLASVLVDGGWSPCSSSESSTALRLRRFAGGPISATAAALASLADTAASKTRR